MDLVRVADSFNGKHSFFSVNSRYSSSSLTKFMMGMDNKINLLAQLGHAQL
jgi:hypothetical protein